MPAKKKINKNRSQEKNIMKIIKTLTDYIILKNFKLWAVRLQPSMDKMEKIDNYLYTKKGETNKKNIENGRLKNMYVSVNCSFLNEWSIGWGAAFYCYLHDQ